MKRFVTDKGIDHIFTFYETKANFAERVIKTIKLSILQIKKPIDGWKYYRI